jgi:hypothetical protein
MTHLQIEQLTSRELEQYIEKSVRRAVNAALEDMSETVHRLAEEAYLQKTWLTLKEAARYADITTTTLRSWRGSGLPESHVEGRIYIKRDHLDAWIEEHLIQDEKRAA